MTLWRCACSVAAAWWFVGATTCPAFAGQTASASRAAQSTLSDALPAAADALPAKVGRYAERLIRRYDKNQDGRLEADEWGKMRGRPEAADLDRDGVITLDELTEFIARFGRNRRVSPAQPIAGPDPSSDAPAHATSAQGSKPERAGPDGVQGGQPAPSVETASQPAGGSRPKAGTFHVPKSRLPAGLPDWFVRRDRDGDGQVSLAEYAPDAAPADVEQFARYDRNGDGFITPRECLPAMRTPERKGSAPTGKSSRQSSAK